MNPKKSMMSGKNKKRNIDAQQLNRVKDELEYATNWRRAFGKVYQHIKWLNSYAKINYIALMKI